MVLPLVLPVDLPQTPGTEMGNQVVLAACSEALSPRRCVLPLPNTPARVSVRWPEPSRAVVQVWNGAEWRHQQLVFDEEDQQEQRWRAVGLVVAAVANEVGEELLVRDPAPPARPIAPLQGVRDSAAPATEPSHPYRSPVQLRAAAAVVGGPGLTRGTWRAGGMVGVGARPAAFPLGVHATLRSTWAPGADREVRSSWLFVGGGPYGSYELRPFGIAGGVDIGWERFTATMPGHPDAAQGTGSRGYTAVQAWATVSGRVNRWVGIWTGTEVTLTPGQRVFLDQEVVGRNPPLAVGILVGIEATILE